jgi:hypothetical protein
VVNDDGHWSYVRQIIKICKPLVDAIGNLESREANLADCMLELLRVGKVLAELKPDSDEDEGFFKHARAVFNQEFEAMNTEVHLLALFLHSLCKRLAINENESKRTVQAMKRATLKIATQWQWCEADAKGLLKNLEAYFHGTAPFNGSDRNALKYWENLTVSGKNYPLKRLAITLFKIVPHSAEVERLFSNLGGIQGVC